MSKHKTLFSGCCGAEDTTRGGSDTCYSGMGKCPEFTPKPTKYLSMFMDLDGRVYDRLTVIGYAGKRGKAKRNSWWCKCSCGNVSCVSTENLQSGHIKSCGCLNRDAAEKRVKHGFARAKDRGHYSPEYATFISARGRCSNTKSPDYPIYGGRGIRFRFTSFEQFLKELGPRPSTNHSLDRYPNNNGHYEPGNVRWATPKEQANNRRFHGRGLAKEVSIDDLSGEDLRSFRRQWERDTEDGETLLPFHQYISRRHDACSFIDKYGTYWGGCDHCGNYDPEPWLEMNENNEYVCEKCSDGKPDSRRALDHHTGLLTELNAEAQAI